MNRIFSLIVISLLILSASLSAQDWTLQNPEGLETFAVIEDIAVLESGVGIATNFSGLQMVTTDNGQSWQVLAEEGANRLFAVEEVPGTMAAFFAGGPSIFWRTDDGGQNWQELTDPTNGSSLFHLEVISEQVIIAGNNGNVYRTLDGGQTWAAITPVDVGFINQISATDQDHIWVSNRTGQYHYTTDGGTTWTTSSTPEGSGWAFIDFASSTTGYLVNATNLYRSSDGGQSWEVRQTGLFASTIEELEVVDEQVLYAIHGTNFYHSTDGGLNVASGAAASNSFQYEGLEYAADGQVWIVEAHGRVLFSDDQGETFIDQIPANRATLLDIDFSDPNTGWAVGGGQVLYTADAGENWENVNSPGSLSDIYAEDAQTALGISNTRLYRTEDQGGNWTIALEHDLRLEEVQVVDGAYLVLGFDFTFYRSEDQGQSWTQLQLVPQTDARSIHFINSSVGFIAGRERLFQTADGGLTWDSLALPVEGVVEDVYFLDADNGWLTYAGITEEIYQTTDGGQTWTTIVLPANFRWKGVFADSPTAFTAYAGASTSGKIYNTTDGGQSWDQLYDRIFVGITAVERISEGETLRWWMCGYGGAIYFLEQSTTSTTFVQNKPLHTFPNPVSDILYIELPADLGEDALISLYTNTGQLLLQQAATPSLDLSALPNGIYLLELRAGDQRYLSSLILQE